MRARGVDYFKSIPSQFFGASRGEVLSPEKLEIGVGASHTVTPSLHHNLGYAFITREYLIPPRPELTVDHGS